MKRGLSLVEMATELERQSSAKKDFVASTEVMDIAVVETEGQKEVKLQLNGNSESRELAINKIAHHQIAAHTKVPQAYYDKMKDEAPELLGENIRHWFRKYPAPRLTRTLDDRLRAFLSNGYRPLENEDLFTAIYPVLMDAKLEIMSCDVTETRLYIKAVDQRIKKDVPSGRRIGDGSHVFFDTCSPAIIVSNSEVGHGNLRVETGVFTKVCTNLATFADGGMKKRHVGARSELVDTAEIQHLLSDDTKRATDKAIWMQVHDVVRNAFDEVRFGERCDQLSELSKNEITGDPVKVVDFAVKKFGLTEGEGSSILKHLIRGSDLTQYGLFNAVTRTAEDLPDYDRASSFEQLGGRIVELPRRDWEVMAKAA